MVGKTYLRFEEAQYGGLLASPQALTCAAGVLHPKTTSAVVPALEGVQVVRIKSGVVEARLAPAGAKRGATLEVSVLALVSLQPTESSGSFLEGYYILAGYANGHVAVFASNPTVLAGAHACKLYALGHKPDTQVLSVAMDAPRTTMASGGQDTDITLWDVSSQESTFRLKGHRGGVVSLAFVPTRLDFLLSGSADGWIKVWDLRVRQCIQTVVASDTQVTSMCLDVSGMRLYCGLRDNVIKVYALQDEAQDPTGEQLLQEHGEIARKANKPVTGMAFSPSGDFLLAWTSKTLEVFRALSAEDVKKKVQRKKKRRRTEASGADEQIDAGDGVEPAGEGFTTATASEEVKHLKTFFLDQKIRSAAFVPATAASDRDALQILVTFNNNSVTTYTTTLTESTIEGAATLTLTDLVPRHELSEHGHHSDVRHLSFVDEDGALLSCGKEGVKLWSVSVNPNYEEEDDNTFYERKEAGLQADTPKSRLSCAGSLAMEDITCCAATTSELVCIGTESGSVHLVNVVAAEILTTQTVHVGAVRSVAMRPDGSGFTSLGADRRLVVWTLALLNDKAQSVSLQLTQEVELNDTPLFIQYSPDGKLAAVGLQDNNVQLFFADTLKPFLVLFGHKLPPSAASFSTDGTLVATVGMDKSLRFWGCDFGDCHRAIHAHDDYVTCVRFVPSTHYVFTCSMDGYVKYWDGDNWTMIQRFRFHQRGLWSLAVNSNGTCFASAGVDRCLRLGMRTGEILFPQEEEERAAQEAMDEDAARRTAMQKLEEKDAEVGVAGQVTSTTTDAAENLMEALDLISVELQRKEAEGGSYQPHLLFRNKSVWEHLWSVIDSIRPSEIRHAVGSLTSTHITALLQYLVEALDAGAVLNYETAAKVVLSLVTPPPGKTHGRAFLSVSGEGVDTAQAVQRLRSLIAKGLQRNVDAVNFNIAGLKFVMQQAAQQDKVRFFDLSKVQGYKKKYNSSAMHQ